MTLRSRLLVAMGLIIVVCVIVGASATVLARNAMLRSADERLLSASGDTRADELEHAGDSDHHRSGSRDGPQSVERQSDLLEGVISSDGTFTAIFRPNVSDDADGGATVSADPVVTLDDLAGSSSRLLTVPASGGSGRFRVVLQATADGAVVVALPLDSVDRLVGRLIAVQAVALALIVAVVLAAAWWVDRLGIRPIREVSHTASAITMSNLAGRVPPAPEGTEAAELADSVNAMIDRIEESVVATERANSRLRNFLADAAHELRNPVATMRGYLELYQMGGLREPEELDDALARTFEESKRLSRLVEEMFLLAQLDNERPLARERVDIAALVDDVGHDSATVAMDHLIEVSVDGPVEVIGDADRLRQVVANLIGNAQVHTPSGTTVRVSCRTMGDRAEVVVSDDGPGIPSEFIDRVTERFVRADASRSRDSGGSGLGLAIVESVVSAMSGRFTVESPVSGGVTATVSLPLADEQLPTGTEPAPSSPT